MPFGSSSLLVMMLDRTCGSETVYRNSDRKLPQPPNGLQHKDIQSPFTKSDEDPNGIKLVESHFLIHS
jgi:hypothetical protein